MTLCYFFDATFLTPLFLKVASGKWQVASGVKNYCENHFAYLYKQIKCIRHWIDAVPCHTQ